jgi:hypothetical protein
LDGAAKLNSFAHSLTVEYRQSAGLAGAHFTDISIRLIAKAVRGGAEEFTFGVELGVNL